MPFSHRCGGTVVGMKWAITNVYPRIPAKTALEALERELSPSWRVLFWRPPGRLRDKAT